MVLVAKEQSGRYFSFTPPKHEVGDYTMDLLFGSPGMRREGVSPEEIGQKIRRDTGGLCEVLEGLLGVWV